MKLLCIACALAAGLLGAEETPTQRETRHHIDLVAIRAAANFRSADSVDAHLREDGAVLHPRLTALHMRIEAALSEAHYEMEQRDYPAVEDALIRADALLDRFAQEIGGY